MATFGPVNKKIWDTVTVDTDKKVQFRDTGVYVQSSSDGVLTLSSDGNTATAITLSASSGGVTVTGDLAVSGDFTFGDVATDNLIIDGDLRISDDRFLHFGTGEDVSLEYDENGGDTLIVTGASWQWGVDGTGVDVTWYGATSGSYLQWDESADQLLLVGGVNLVGGTSGTPITHTANTDKLSEFNVTNSGTSGNYEPFLWATTTTGAGMTGGRAKFTLTANAALGSWSNALKAETIYGVSGSTTGLGSAFVAELSLSAGTTSGTYAPLELELNIGSGASLGTRTSFGYFSVQGADVTEMDDNGYLLSINGLTASSGKLFQSNTAADATHALRIDIGGTDYYIMLTNQAA